MELKLFVDADVKNWGTCNYITNDDGFNTFKAEGILISFFSP